MLDAGPSDNFDTNDDIHKLIGYQRTLLVALHTGQVHQDLQIPGKKKKSEKKF